MKIISADLMLRAADGLSESPVWDERQHRLWWTDIHACRICCAALEQPDHVVRFATPSRVGAVGLRSNGGLVLALENGFALFNDETGQIQRLASLNNPQPNTRLNDGRVDPLGNFVCGGMVEGDGRPGSTDLYRLSPEGDVETVVRGITCANATCWSADSQHMFFSDMPTGRVDRRRYHGWGQPLGEPEPFVQLHPSEGLPDGATVDEEGGLWLAVWGGGKVIRIGPDGVRDHEVLLPVTNPTSVAFVGDGLATLCITTAQFGLRPDQLAAEPLAGHVFACAPGLAGRVEARFHG